MLIPLGILAAAGASAPASAGSYDLLATTILSSSQASVTFSSLDSYAADYQHLQIRMTARTDRAITLDNVSMILNSDTGNNYTAHSLIVDGSSVSSTADLPLGRLLAGLSTGSTFTSSAFAGSVADLLDVFSSSKYTTMRSMTGVPGTANSIRFRSGVWLNTASVTSILLRAESGNNLVSGSRFSLYGLKAS